MVEQIPPNVFLKPGDMEPLNVLWSHPLGPAVPAPLAVALQVAV